MTTEELTILKQMGVRGVIRKYLPRKISGEISEATYDALLKLVTPVVVRPEVEGPQGDSSPEGNGSGPIGDREPDERMPSQDQRTTPDRSEHTDQAKGQSQKQRLLTLLQDKHWHDTKEIMNLVYRVGEDRGNCRIPSRICELRQEGYNIETKRITQTLTAYRLTEKQNPSTP